MKKIAIPLLVLAFVLAGNAYADLISGASITPSTSMTSSGSFVVDEIADGITSDASPYNGFSAASATAGTITLDLDAVYNITDFYLWNDINVVLEGIDEFRLDFRDADDVLISSSPVYNGPLGQLGVEQYSFTEVLGVSSVDLVVQSTHNVPGTFRQQIEIREVAFEGTVVPEPSTIALFAIGIGMPLLRRKRKLKA